MRRIKRIRRIRKKKIWTKFKIKSSKIERQFGVYLKSLGIEIESQYQLAWKFYDFKIKGKNILIEFDGDLWHCNPLKYPNGPITKTQVENIMNDKYKDILAEANGFKLIRVWENDFRKNKLEVGKKILKLLND